MESNSDTTQTQQAQQMHPIFQNEVMQASNNVQPVSQIPLERSDESTNDNSQSKSDQFNDLQSLIMNNDISPEELQKQLDEI